MKVLLVNGSPRAKGNTSIALNEIIKVCTPVYYDSPNATVLAFLDRLFLQHVQPGQNRQGRRGGQGAS